VCKGGGHLSFSKMAKFHAPDKFDFRKPTDWPEWSQRFKRYRRATKLDAEDGDLQVAALIYSMGPEAEVIFNMLTIVNAANGQKAPLTNAQKDDFEVVMEAFGRHFQPQINHLDYQIDFGKRTQSAEESIETFVRALYELAENCDFGQQKSVMIRKQLIIGIRDSTLEQELRLKGNNLTVEEAISIARNWEQVKKHMGDEPKVKELDVVTKPTQYERGRRPFNRRGARDRGGSNSSRNTSRNTCLNCGRDHSKEERCPAYGQRCYGCSRVGHFRYMCRAQDDLHVKEITSQMSHINTVEEEDDDRESFFLYSVDCDEGDNPWYVRLPILGRGIRFKADSGADVTVITENTYKCLKRPPPLELVRNKLKSLGGELSCIGKFKCETTLNEQKCTLTIYVVRGGHGNLLSRNAAHKMQILSFNMNIAEIESAFGEVGLMKTEPVKIAIRPDAEPFHLSTARRVPLPLVPLVEEELQRMVKGDIIREVTVPTDWCAPMVVTRKKNNKVRICVDLKKLNKAVKRERYVIPAIQDILGKLSGSVKFSSLDMSGAYWQLPLAEESQHLTTFITPIGRYYFTRVPYGITSASEIFQRKMSEVLSNIEGVSVYQDDIIVSGCTDQEHDSRLKEVLEKVRESGLKLNRQKCEIGRRDLEFLGHHVSAKGTSPHPDKVRAISKMKAPTNVSELRSVLGMIQYLGQYMSNLSSQLKPLNDLLKKDTAWTWGTDQEKAFDSVKRLVTEAPCLAFYDLSKPTVVSADASSYGIGGTILQETDGKLRPIAYCSRMLTPTERKWAQIEKECLASVWVCEKFERYLVGLPSFRLQTDHKPLVPLIGDKSLDEVPLRCQRLLMRMMRFNPIPEYVPGRELVVADVLSRSPLADEKPSDMEEEVDCYVHDITSRWPASENRMDRIRNATREDPLLRQVMEYTMDGWPKYKKDVPVNLHDMYEHQGHLSVVDGLLVFDDRIVIPESMQSEVLDRIHDGHPGIVKSRERAKQAVWWRGLSTQIKERVEKCSHCVAKRPEQHHEPLISTPLPKRPWDYVGMDLCEHKKRSYLVVSDYYSRYIEIAQLTSTTASAVIDKVQSMFARWGIPSRVISDNGPQFASEEFANFAREYDFIHITSSPRYAQSNGGSERAVAVAKAILDQDNPNLALMTYRDTPIAATGKSPNELMINRKVKTRVPCLEKKLAPQTVDIYKVRAKDAETKTKDAMYYNKRHGVRHLGMLKPGDPVRLRQGETWQPAIVSHTHHAPRSYLVQTSQGGVYRRNRRDILYTREQPFPPIGKFQPSIGTDHVMDRQPGQIDASENLSMPQESVTATETIPPVPLPVPVQVRQSSRIKVAPAYLKEYVN
jgi:transposase InsO family protein